MILQTGGRASGEISTRSRPSSLARRRASSVSTIPTISPASSISRTGVMRMRSFSRGPDAGPSRRGRSPPNPPGRGPEPELKGGRRGGKLEIGESLGRIRRQYQRWFTFPDRAPPSTWVRSDRAADGDCTRAARWQANQGGISVGESRTGGIATRREAIGLEGAMAHPCHAGSSRIRSTRGRQVRRQLRRQLRLQVCLQLRLQVRHQISDQAHLRLTLAPNFVTLRR